MIFHKHQFKLEERTLFCRGCGKVENVQCMHKWKQWKIYEAKDSIRGGNWEIIVLQCEKCGDLSKFSTHPTH